MCLSSQFLKSMRLSHLHDEKQVRHHDLKDISTVEVSDNGSLHSKLSVHQHWCSPELVRLSIVRCWSAQSCWQYVECYKIYSGILAPLTLNCWWTRASGQYTSQRQSPSAFERIVLPPNCRPCLHCCIFQWNVQHAVLGCPFHQTTGTLEVNSRGECRVRQPSWCKARCRGEFCIYLP